MKKDVLFPAFVIPNCERSVRSASGLSTSSVRNMRLLRQSPRRDPVLTTLLSDPLIGYLDKDSIQYYLTHDNKGQIMIGMILVSSPVIYLVFPPSNKILNQSSTCTAVNVDKTFNCNITSMFPLLYCTVNCVTSTYTVNLARQHTCLLVKINCSHRLSTFPSRKHCSLCFFLTFTE